MPGGFDHYEQSLRVVDLLENDGRGLNLTWEVRDGIAKHSKGKSGAPVAMSEALRAGTMEGQIMRVADLIAYVNHDIDDATRAGLLRPEDLPPEPVRTLGATSSARIATLVTDVVKETLAGGMTDIRMSDPGAAGGARTPPVPVQRRLREQHRDRRVQESGRHPERSVGEGPRAVGRLPGPTAPSVRRGSMPPPGTSWRA